MLIDELCVVCNCTGFLKRSLPNQGMFFWGVGGGGLWHHYLVMLEMSRFYLSPLCGTFLNTKIAFVVSLLKGTIHVQQRYSFCHIDL